MAELASSSAEQPASKFTFDVDLETNEVEVKYKGNPTWTHITKWNCGVVPETDDLQIDKELHKIKTLQKTFHDNLRVTLTRIRNRIHCILFVFGHDNLDSAFQMAIKVDRVKATISEFLQEIDPNLKNSSLRCWVGEHNESSEQDNKNSDEKSESIVFSVTDNRKGCTSETDWSCSFGHDEFEIDLTSSRRTFTKLKSMFQNSYHCFLKLVRRGSLIIECEHESREDALEMMKNHVNVKATILECLHEMDLRVNAIKIEVEYREIERDHLAKDPSPLTASVHTDMRIIREQKYDQAVNELKQEVLSLKKRLRVKSQELAQLQRVQPSGSASDTASDTDTVVGDEDLQDTKGTRMPTRKRSVSPSSSDSSGFGSASDTASDTDTVVGDEDLQDTKDPLLEPGHPDERYVDKQEHDQDVRYLQQQVLYLMFELQDMKEMERQQLSDTRMSLWMRPDSPQPSESTGFFTATDTITDVGEELFQTTEDLSEAEGRHRHKGGVSEPGQTSGSMTDLTRQLADLKQELKATTERLHRLETTHKKAPDTDTGREPGRRDTPQGSDQHGGASSHPSEMEALRPGATQESELPATSREEETRKSGIPLGPDTRATPTPARRDPRADRSLRKASSEGDMAAVKRILAAGRADVNCRDGVGRTPVMWAARRRHRDVVELLVSEGADVSLVDKDGDNTLHYACGGGDVETVKYVLSLHVADINSIAVWSTTPVMWAAVEGHRDVVELLVSEEADVSLVDKDGDNILHLACWGGHVETVKFVLSLHVVDINSRGRRSWTPVMRAAWRGHRDMVELLVSEGADVSMVDEVGNNTLHYACMGGDVETVKYVLSLHVVDINSRDESGRTPVMAAAVEGHRDVVKLLVSEGADVSLVDEVGNNILHFACMGGDVETVKFVLSQNVVDIDARNNDGQTAADLARDKGHQEVVKLLEPSRGHVM